MKQTIFKKAGEYLTEKRMTGRLYRNVIKIEKMEANITHMLPGAKSQPYKHRGHEIHIMFKGEAEFRVGKEKYMMQEGDMLFHSSMQPHSSRNPGTSQAVYITISTPPTFTMFEKQKPEDKR